MSLISDILHQVTALDVNTLMFLIVGAMVAGFVDAICGGGGLLSIPILLFGGLSPAQAIAANKLQGAFGALSSTYYYHKNGVLHAALVWKLVPGAIVGGVGGTLLLNMVGNSILEKLLPILLIAMALYFGFSKSVNDIPRKARVGFFILGISAVLPIGIYDGFFGPGAGSFYMLALIALGGMSLTQSLAYSRVLNLASNLTSLGVFIALGKVPWAAGIAMSIGEVIGVYAGSSLAHKKGARFIKPLLVVACTVMAITFYVRGHS